MGIAVAIFLGFFSILLFGGLIPLWLLLATAAVPAAWGVYRRRGELQSWRFPPAAPNKIDRLYRMVLLIILLTGLFVLARFIGVPVQSFDLLSYHLPLARSMAATGEARNVLLAPEIFYARMPLGAPIVQAPLVFGGWRTGFGIGFHLFSAMSILAGAVSCARVAGWFGAKSVGMLLAAGFYLFHDLMIRSLVNGVYDPTVGLMAMAGAELTLQSYSRSGPGWYALLAGGVAATAGILKFSALGTALVPVGIIAAAGMWRFREGTPWSVRGRGVLVFAVGAAIVLLPWFARAVFLGGSPMFPFTGESAAWTAEQGRFVVEQHHPLNVFSGAYWSGLFSKLSTFGYPLILPWIPALLAAALLGAYRRRSVAPFVAAALAGYAAWLTVELNPGRFLIPASVLLIPPAVIGFSLAMRKAENRRFVELAAIGILLLNAWPSIRDAYYFKPVYTQQARDYAMDSLGPQMSVVRFARTDTENRGRLLLFFETQTGLFPPGTEARTVWDQPSWAPLLKQSGTPEQFENALREEGYTGIYVNDFEWGRLLQFYARDQIDPGQVDLPEELQGYGLMQLMSVRSPLAEQGLAAYPPYRFAKFADRDLTVLLEFLRSKRNGAEALAQLGPYAEAWYARLKIE